MNIGKSRLSTILMTFVAIALMHGVPQAQAGGAVKIRISWGHESATARPFLIKLIAATTGTSIEESGGRGLEPGEGLRDAAWQTTAGHEDVDGVEFTFKYPERTAGTRKTRKAQQIWTTWFTHTDGETAARVRNDPAFEIDPPLLTVQMNAAGTQGFSVSVDQLLQNKGLYVPSLDVYLSAGAAPQSFADHKKAIAPFHGSRILDRTHQESEASYAQFTSRWPDMGNPRNNNPSHIVGLTWDSAIEKFGVDRQATVLNDLGAKFKLRFAFDFPEAAWDSQRLNDGLPVVTTVFAAPGLRYEVEQFAYPLQGPPATRQGNMAMVLLQKVTVVDLEGKPRQISFGFSQNREVSAAAEFKSGSRSHGRTVIVEDTASRRILFSFEGASAHVLSRDGSSNQNQRLHTVQRRTDTTVWLELPANGRRELVIKLPATPLEPSIGNTLTDLDYARAREATVKFWSDILARGAQFRVPEPAVNELFRANLWHALRLPRRHGGAEANVAIDLPYSNFAYGQEGTPWPVIQGVYVDYMLYDLRGYHDISVEELLAIYRGQQKPNGRLGGVANWGVYTPGMIYAVAKNYLLSRDAAAFEKLLPPTLKALDYCLGEIKAASEQKGASAGLVLAPLNDLTGNGVWAINQAYFFAALDLLARALDQIGHPRALECRNGAAGMQRAIERGFGEATMRSPLVQLRDRTWIPYVPCEALTPRRLLEEWYPADIDTGATHLPRLKALAPNSGLTDYILHDHEDNLYLKGWGMANEPVYNQQATAYLLRDDPKAAIRAFYSQMASAFSHTVFEPVEHRWGWGQYFGPPSTDGSWFELYRNMLIDERDDDTLSLLQATPRSWLEQGKRIEIARAPTYYGNLSVTVDSQAVSGRISATIVLSDRSRPKALWLRLRHPWSARIQSVTVNGRAWSDFDAAKERIRIGSPDRTLYTVIANY